MWLCAVRHWRSVSELHRIPTARCPPTRPLFETREGGGKSGRDLPKSDRGSTTLEKRSLPSTLVSMARGGGRTPPAGPTAPPRGPRRPPLPAPPWPPRRRQPPARGLLSAGHCHARVRVLRVRTAGGLGDCGSAGGGGVWRPRLVQHRLAAAWSMDMRKLGGANQLQFKSPKWSPQCRPARGEELMSGPKDSDLEREEDHGDGPM